MHPRLGLAIALTGQLFFTACTSQELRDFIHSDGSAVANPPAVLAYAPGGQQYGIKGSVTQEQFLQIEYLAWPQTREAMTGSFGFPAHLTETKDYYALEGNDSTWVVITYNGRTATGFTLEDR